MLENRNSDLASMTCLHNETLASLMKVIEMLSMLHSEAVALLWSKLSAYGIPASPRFSSVVNLMLFRNFRGLYRDREALASLVIEAKLSLPTGQ